MKIIWSSILILTAVSLADAQPAMPAVIPPTPYHAAPPLVFWLVFGAMTLVVFVGIVALSRILKRDKDWSFADAMSEDDGKPSSSRLIAFFGMLVMTTVILGLGYSTIWIYLEAGQLPVLSGVTTFLVACAGLFSPYLVKQISQSVSSQPAPTTLAPVVTQTVNSANLPGAPLLPVPPFGPPVKPGSL